MNQQMQNNGVEYRKISELCDLRKGKKVNSSKAKTKNSIPYLLIDTLRGAEPEFFTEEKDYTEAIPNDILIVADGANSGLVGTGVSGAVGSTILRIRINVDNLNKNYLSYFLKSKFEEFNTDMKGTGIPHLKPQKMLESKIRMPSTQEQTLIVQEIETQFTRLDEAVKSLKSVKENLEVYRKAILKKAFEKKEDWEEKKIKDISEFVEYGTSKKAGKEGKIPVIRMGNLQRGKILFDNLKFYNSLEDIENLILSKGDLLFNRTNSYELVGKTSIFNGSDFDKVTFASYLIRIRVKNEEVIPEYLNYFLNSSYAEILKKDLKSQQVGQANINGTKLKNIVLPLPSLSEQTLIVQEIESKFSVIDKVEQVVETSLEKAEKLRKSILKSAFEGKLVRLEEVQNA